MPQQPTRRQALKAAGITLTGIGMMGTVTASSTFAQQLSRVRSASQQYKDVSTAREAGYDAIMSPYESGMGFHFANPAHVAPDENAPKDLTKLAVLVYYTNGSYNPDPGDLHDPDHDDDLILGAVEFAHAGTKGADADYFDDENAQRKVKTPEAHGWHYVPEAGFTATHVWVHRDNPEGVFHDTNRTID